MNDVDFFIDEDDLELLIGEIKTFKDCATATYGHMSGLSRKIYHYREWTGNGAEECAAFLELISRYFAYIIGLQVDEFGIITESALAEKNVVGGEDHIEEFCVTAEKLIKDAATYERGGDAEPINTLKGLG